MITKKSSNLIPVPPEGAPWFMEGAEFALTFNGYERHGEEASQIANRVFTTFNETGHLPEDLNMLRCSLFFEQRRIRWNEPSNLLNDACYRNFIEALLSRIRKISGGFVEGPPDRGL
jgi:hypothetical protein